MVEDHGLAAALGLGTLPRVVDNEWIEMGHGAEGQLGEAGATEAQPLAWEPFQVAVLAHMNHGMATEALA